MNQQDPNQALPEDVREMLEQLGVVIIDSVEPNDIQSKKERLV